MARQILADLRTVFEHTAEVLKAEMMDALDLDEAGVEQKLREDMSRRA